MNTQRFTSSYELESFDHEQTKTAAAEAFEVPTLLGALLQLASVGWYRKIAAQQTDPVGRRTNIISTMTATGILAALMFGFTGGALWAIQDTGTFAAGPQQGLMVVFMMCATLSFLLSAVWSVLILLMSGLMLDEELHRFLKNTGLLELLPLFLFLVGIVFVALGLFWWLWIILYVSQWPYLLVAYVLVAVLALQSVYTFMASVRGLFLTRREYLDTAPLSLSSQQIHLLLDEYVCTAREDADPRGFSNFVLAHAVKLASKSSTKPGLATTTKACAPKMESIPRLAYLTQRRAQIVFEEFVLNKCKEDGAGANAVSE